MKRRFLAKTAGFSLTEIIVVLVIISIVVVFALPGFRDTILGSNVVRAGATVEDNFKLAQLRAASRNRTIEVRLYRYKDPETLAGEAFQALQMFEKMPDQSYAPLGRVVQLPESIVMIEDPEYSSLLTDSETEEGSDKPDIPRVGKNYTYRRIEFSRNGGMSFQDKSKLYYVTVAKATPFPPKNFYTVQVDPVNAKVTSYHP